MYFEAMRDIILTVLGTIVVTGVVISGLCALGARFRQNKYERKV